MYSIRIIGPDIDTSLGIIGEEDFEMLDAIVCKMRKAVRKPVGGLDCGVDLRTGRGICVCGKCSQNRDGEHR